MDIYIAFSDAKETKIVAWFQSPQPPELGFPFYGVVQPDDPRWIDYFESLPESVRDWLPTPIYP
ncbi:TPA: hypothetical protein PXM28_002637 [Yersinia enterocolitica]|nr:hypothetical protein [Yersinia enterocolitica]